MFTRYRRLILFVGVLATAVASAVLLTGIFVNFDDPLFQRSALRLLAVVALIAVLAMFGTLLTNMDGIEGLTEEHIRVPARRQRHHRR